MVEIFQKAKRLFPANVKGNLPSLYWPPSTAKRTRSCSWIPGTHTRFFFDQQPQLRTNDYRRRLWLKQHARVDELLVRSHTFYSTMATPHKWFHIPRKWNDTPIGSRRTLLLQRAIQTTISTHSLSFLICIPSICLIRYGGIHKVPMYILSFE